MAAAEYYSSAPMGPSHQSSPYLQPHPNTSHPNFQSHPPHFPPPPYQAIQQDTRPSVHFEDRPPPARPERHSFSSQAPIPVFTDQQQQQYHQQHRPSISKPPFSPSPQPSQPQQHAGPGPYLQQPFQQPYHQRQTHSPAPPANPQYLSPYAHVNQSQYSINGYSSDPEPHRRRRRRHSTDHRDGHRSERDSRAERGDRSERGHKNRSRSTNTDGFLGAAGGGLIGDMIFPGLGTVGGALAGWIGGKDYGKHRKQREGKLDRDQEQWEHRFGRDSDEHGHSRGDRERRSYERHKSDH